MKNILSSVPAALVVRARPVFFFFFYGFAFSKKERIKTECSVQDILKIYRGGGGGEGKGGSGDCVEGEVTWFLGGNG